MVYSEPEAYSEYRESLQYIVHIVLYSIFVALKMILCQSKSLS